MSDEPKDQYVQRTVIVKRKKEEGKLKRFTTPIRKLMEWEIKDPKKSRVEA